MSEWLKNLKVGDEVFVCSNGSKSLEKVQKVTPKGRIVVNNTLYTDGANRSNMWGIMRLEEAKEEKIQQYKIDVFIRKVYAALKINKSMNYEQAKQINELLNLGVKEND